MQVRAKSVIVAQTAFIILLLFFIGTNKLAEQNYYKGFLAPSVYAGILQPKSFSILNFAPLRNYLQNYIDNNSLDVSLYLENLKDESNFVINGNKGAIPGSLNKIPVAILTMNRIERGELSYDTKLPVNKTILNNDTDKIYFENDRLPVKLLLEKMLKESDNDAFFILFRNMDIDHLNTLMDYYNMDPVNSFKYVGVDFENNRRLTPKSFANMFLSLYFSTVLETKDSEYILKLLSNTTFDIRQATGLPEEVIIAHKYGINVKSSPTVFNDCGIMYINTESNGRILYCISVRGQDTDKSITIVGDTLKTVYDYYTYKRLELDTFKQNITSKNIRKE